MTGTVSSGKNPLTVVGGGFGGLIGGRLSAQLSARGDRVKRLVRPSSQGGDDQTAIAWNPAANEIDTAALAGADAVIALGGVNIAERRWSPAFKARIRDSRLAGTALLSRTLATMEQPPSVLITASAIGYYGDRGQQLLEEGDPPGEDFLAGVVRDWEAATEPAAAAGIRVVNARIGVVLAPDGGALGKMLLPFKLGLGGKVANGRQTMSWIAIDDVVAALIHCLDHKISGPVNLVAPNPVSNRDFATTLAKVLRRPAILPLPAFAVRTLLGEMGQALLLASTRVSAKKLTDSGFAFAHPQLAGALRQVLGYS